ncbi:MAG: GDSL-type esterase/lipase family protein, partial [Candidatus Ornithomonoglobus sp.]
LANTSNDIKTIKFETSYNNSDRACLIDNVKVSTQTAPQYAITVNAVNAADKSAIASAQITVTETVTKAEITPNADGKYMLCEGDYIITASADGYRTVQMPLELTPALESKTINVEMTSDTDLTPATVTIKYVDEEGTSLKDNTIITNDVYVGDSYTVPDELLSDFAVKNSDGKTNLYQFNASKSTTEVTLTENTEITLVFNLVGQYDYYEDFENYTLNDSEWKNGDGAHSLTIANDNSSYLSYTCTGTSSVGSYTTFNEINCEGKTIKIEADLKFAPTSITGDSQFSIGNTSPSFSSNKISYGFENSAGHIIGLVHKKGSASFLVNGQSISTDLIGDWVHLEADADFISKKVTVKLTNNNGYIAVVENADFYSSSVADNIGSMYVRAASGSGTVGVDNLKIAITGDGIPAEPEIKSVLNYKTVYAFGDSIVYGHNAPNNAFMNLIANKYSMYLTKYAKNGATVIDSGNDIIAQVNSASEVEPDFIVFDGYTNDAYGDPASDSFNAAGANPDVTKILGTIQGSGVAEFDSSTFCGAFEEILYTMKQKWPNSKLVFVTIHKSGARDFDIQTTLHDLSVQMCEAWDVAVVDMFKDAALDTRNPDEMAQYIINGAGSHPNVACCEEFYVPMIAEKLIEVCGGEQAVE